MSERVEFALPDIGDFHDVDVVEVLVAVGDRVEAEQALIVIESEKASMEVPSPRAGVVESLAAGYIDPLVGGGFSRVASYLVLIAVLFVRPYGLFGRPDIERV